MSGVVPTLFRDEDGKPHRFSGRVEKLVELSPAKETAGSREAAIINPLAFQQMKTIYFRIKSQRTLINNSEV
jgi:hypothetical protein